MGKELALIRFKTLFPNYSESIVKWTPEKDGSIRIELTEKRFFVFHYIDDRTWKLESLRYHLKKESF